MGTIVIFASKRDRIHSRQELGDQKMMFVSYSELELAEAVVAKKVEAFLAKHYRGREVREDTRLLDGATVAAAVMETARSEGWHFWIDLQSDTFLGAELDTLRDVVSLKLVEEIVRRRRGWTFS